MCISRVPWHGEVRICRDPEGKFSVLDYGSEPRDDCNTSHSDYSVLVRHVDDSNSYHVAVKSDTEFNYSSMLFPNVIWLYRPMWEITAKSLAVVPLVICGVLFNLMLLNIVVRLKQLHTPSNLLMANMAVADMATLLICSWMLLCSDLSQNYVLGEFGCKLQGFFECFLLLTSVLNLVVISYDRLMAIAQPLEARLTVQVTYYIMVVTWFIGIIVGSPLIFYRTYHERKWLNFFETYCSEDPANYIYWYIVVTLIIWFPLIVMTICYIAIFVEMDRYEQRILRRGEHVASVGHKTRVARIMFGVVVVFIVCRVPFTALVIRRTQIMRTASKDTVDPTFQVLWFTSKYLMLANSAVNPLIYGMTNRNLQRGFAKLPLSRWLLGGSGSHAATGTTQQPQDQVRQRRQRVRDNPPRLHEEGAAKYWFVAPERHRHHDVKPLPTEYLYI